MSLRADMQKEVMLMNMETELEDRAKRHYGRKFADLDNKEIYYILLSLTKEMCELSEHISGDKKVYYISAEFLIGKLLSNNLINLGLYDKIEEILSKNGKTLADIEENEPEPSLGNGGLGRLASCFLDSMATMGIHGDGIGLNYHFGLFKQVFKNKLQKAEKNEWIEPKSWLIDTGVSFPVQFKGMTVHSKLYDIDVVGYRNGTNRLHLFDIESVDESIAEQGIDFDKTKIKKNLTLFLYPDDSDEAGNLLRIYQQYFMVSNAAQLILRELKEQQYDLLRMYDYCVIQINDTHPTLIIPELIRILVNDKAFTIDEAIEVISKCVAYTNHTILAEALEKWPLEYIDKVAPQLVPIIRELDKKVRAKYRSPKVQIIDKENRVHMAHMDIHYGFSVNGVAAIHTEILKNTELNAFYKIYPEKFNNKTNGITFRRWLLSCNHSLADYITELIGQYYKKDAMQLEKLMDFIDNEMVLDRIAEIKMDNKKALAKYIYEHEGIQVDPHSIFDIQVKRLHEYKRQQMNALYIIYKYLEVKHGRVPSTPITFIFGGKAAPAYVLAKDIIHLILVLADIVNNDPEASKYLRVVMLENYNVSYAEKVIPACDVSEQISLASKEASGTGNMKFMLNGAVTLGTRDGANVEIGELVGEDNIYFFGTDSDTVIKHIAKKDYDPKDCYEKSKKIKSVVDFITGEKCLKAGMRENLERLKNNLINDDPFMTLLDFEAYVQRKEEIFADYEKRTLWKKMMLTNIAKAGFFSSDRTIGEYNRDIWHINE